MLKRRSFLTCGCGAGVAACLPSRGMAAPYPPFCASLPQGGISLSQTSNTTGRKDLDNALIYEVKRIRTFFGVHPGVRILDDAGSPNAFATPDTLLANTRGTVLLGRTLIQSELVSRMGGIAVAGIVAHECAHILQYDNKLIEALRAGEPTAKRVELHADYLAGFYFGTRAARRDLEIDPFTHSLLSKGDWAFNSPQHHGTPAERRAAMLAGFEYGKSGARSAQQASLEGVTYVRTL